MMATLDRNQSLVETFMQPHNNCTAAFLACFFFFCLLALKKQIHLIIFSGDVSPTKEY